MRSRPHLRFRGATIGLLVGLLGVLLPLTVDVAPAAAAPGDLPLTTVRAMVVDPDTGRVFVAGDDAVVVLDAAGSVLATIPDIYGASGMDATQGAIWVNESTAGKIARIDPVSMTVTTTYDVGHPVGNDLMILGTAAWIGNGSQFSGIDRYDLTTGAFTTVGSFYGPSAMRRGSSTTDLIVYERGLSSGRMYRISATAPYTTLATGRVGGYLGQLAANSAGTRIWSASGSPYRFQEFDGTTFAPTALYPAEPYPRAITWSASHGGMIAGVTYGLVDVYSVGRSAQVASLPVASLAPYPPIAFGLSPDGDTAYVIAANTSTLKLLDLRPTVKGSSPTSVVQTVPTPVTVTGTALGGTTSVSVGGVEVEPDTVSPTSVTFTMPVDAPVGTPEVVLHGTTGDATSTVTVTESTGAVLRGTVRTGSDPVPGATLTLSGGALATALQVTADADGGYEFDPVGFGSTYALTVQDPAGSAPDQTIKAITLTPNQGTTLDVDLSRPIQNGSELARTTLGMTSASDLLVDPATGKIVVAGGDEVAILDPDGLLIARVRGLDGARSLTMLDGAVYVGVAFQSKVARIDLATASITGSWPLGSLTNGSIAAAGGKIWFVKGNDQWTTLSSLDPTTGTITASSGSLHVPLLRSVEGAPTWFTASQQGISPAPTTLFDGSGATASVIAATDSSEQPTSPRAPLVANAATGRVYDSQGAQFKLTDLKADGVRYPSSGPPAFTAGHGGLVAFGTGVARAGVPSLTHAFGTTSSATGLNSSGDRLYSVEGSQFVVRTLAPVVTGVTGTALSNATVTLRGNGFGTMTSVEVDGQAVPFHDVTASTVEIDLPTLGEGVHQVVVTTSWGTSEVAPLAIQQPDPPGPPRSPTAVAISGGVKVSWTAPSSDGGDPITSYTVTLSPGGQTCTTTALTCAVTGLAPGTTVSGTVTATNSMGTSAPSTATGAVTTPNVPDAPTAVGGTPGPSRLLATWTAPASDGGSPIASYRVCISTDPAVPPTSSTCADTGTAITSRSLTGLTPLTTYYVRVRAQNVIGSGSWSVPSAGIVPFTVPSAPTSPSATPGDGEATVSWTAPASDGGSTVTGYAVTPYIGAAAQPVRTFAGSATTRTITGLTNGTSYTFRVAALNPAGPSELSAATAAVTPVGAGGLPTPFTSWDAFVARQLTDLTGDPGTPAGRAATVAALAGGSTSPEAYIEGLLANPWYGPAMAPTARLYWAYFGRIPDQGGLQYWTAKRRNGTTLVRISASFAGSSEFRRTYGSLSNGAFVDLVYRNVLGRPADAAGRTYWVRKLNAGTSRGQLMVNFSESGEYVRRQAGPVGVVEVYAAMLHRSPTPGELTTWADQPLAQLIIALRLGTEYAELVG